MPPIRVLYDEQIFLLQEYGGISRYFTELIRAFDENPNLGIKPIINGSSVRNQYLLHQPTFDYLRPIRTQLGSIYRLAIQMMFDRKDSEHIDLVHHTFYLPGFLKRFNGISKAVTLFDMIPESIEGKRGFMNAHFMKKAYLRHANLVLSISHSSTSAMQKEYGNQIVATTTYLAVGEEYAPNLPSVPGLPARYFLYVGNRGGYKDCDLAIRAFANVSREVAGVSLLLVGGGKLRRYEEKLIRKLGVEGNVLQKSVTPEELPNTYSNTLGLLFPSRQEGFGLPILEAMSSGVPVLASETSINREIAQDCASFFPVADATSLQNLMLRVLSSPKAFRDKIEAGKIRSRNFTWKKCAEVTAKEYRRIIEKQKVKG